MSNAHLVVLGRTQPFEHGFSCGDWCYALMRTGFSQQCTLRRQQHYDLVYNCEDEDKMRNTVRSNPLLRCVRRRGEGSKAIIAPRNGAAALGSFTRIQHPGVLLQGEQSVGDDSSATMIALTAGKGWELAYEKENIDAQYGLHHGYKNPPSKPLSAALSSRYPTSAMLLSEDLSLVPLYIPILITVLFAVWATRKTKKHPPLPPGPSGLPILGNMFDLPKEKAWIKYAELANHHSMFFPARSAHYLTVFTETDILSFQVLTQTAIVLSSADVARALLEKRSDIYSDRPVSVMDKL